MAKIGRPGNFEFFNRIGQKQSVAPCANVMSEKRREHYGSMNCSDSVAVEGGRE